jgi:hypothetical protein
MSNNCSKSNYMVIAYISYLYTGECNTSEYRHSGVRVFDTLIRLYYIIGVSFQDYNSVFRYIPKEQQCLTLDPFKNGSIYVHLY